MLHRDDAGAGGDTLEPTDFVVEPDDNAEQYEDDTRPELTEPHRHRPRCDQKRQTYRAGDRGPGEKGDVEGEPFRPNHRTPPASADVNPGAPASHSTTGRSSAPRYLQYSFASSSTAPREIHQCSWLTSSGKTGCAMISISGIARPSSSRLRRMWYHPVTTRKLLKPCWRIHWAVSRALPRVLSASWPSAVQQDAQSALPETRNSSSRSTCWLTPDTKSFRPFPSRSRSMPLCKRKRPPVSTTIASVGDD